MAAPTITIKAGDMIEGYKVLAELGRGAASIIYLVQDPKTKQVWALKHVERHHGAKDARFLDQAEYEFKVAQQLSHPGIRRIERCIKKTQRFLTLKELYLVMELVDGGTLDKVPPKTFEWAVNVFLQIAQAMAHMHAKGFVHADMKPNNIIVTDKGVAKIIDLGQSCPIGTVKPRIQGTPDYIAPEQVHRRPITPKTDVYNLGATMYWVLTRNFIPTALARGDSLVGSLDDNMIQKPTPAIEINPRIPARLSELTMQCVEVDPEKRPADMNVVVDRLTLILGLLRAEAARKNGESSFNALDSAAD